jgi:hypothetical protein
VKAVAMVNEYHLQCLAMETCCSGVEFQPLAYKSYIFTNRPTSTLFFQPASSFYPGREIDVPLANDISDIDQFSDTNGGETEIDSVNDWLPEPQGPQPSGSGPRASALALEVRFSVSYYLSNFDLFFSDHHGRTLMKLRGLRRLL